MSGTIESRLNNAVSSGGGGAVSSVSNSDGTLTISPTTGAIVASLALGHANTWTGAQTFNSVNLTQDVSFSNIITPTTLTTTTNDYAPTSFSTAYVVRVSCNADFVLVTGLAGGTAGRTVILENVGTKILSLSNENTGSSAANRFIFDNSGSTATHCRLQPADQITLTYDGTSSRWRSSGSRYSLFTNFSNDKAVLYNHNGAVTQNSGGLNYDQSSGVLGSPKFSQTIGPVLGGVVFVDAGTAIFNQSANLYWDNTNARLGIGTATPGANLDIVTSATGTPSFRIKGIVSQTADLFNIINSGNNPLVNISAGGLMTWGISSASNTNNVIEIYNTLGGNPGGIALHLGGQADCLNIIQAGTSTNFGKINSNANWGMGQASIDDDFKVSINPDAITVSPPSAPTATIIYFPDQTGASGIITYDVGSYQALGTTQGIRVFGYHICGGVKVYGPNYSQATVTDNSSTYTVATPGASNSSINYGSGSYVAAAQTISYEIFAYWNSPAGIVYSSANSATAVTDLLNDGSSFNVDISWGASTAPVDGYRILRDINAGGFIDYVDVVSATTFNDDNTLWTSGSTVTPTSLPEIYEINWSWTLDAQPPVDGYLIQKSNSLTGQAYNSYKDVGYVSTLLDDGSISWTSGNPETNTFYLAVGSSWAIQVYSYKTILGVTIYSSVGPVSSTVMDDASNRPFYVEYAWSMSTLATGYKVLPFEDFNARNFDVARVIVGHTNNFLDEGNATSPTFPDSITVTPSSTSQGALAIKAGSVAVANGSHFVLGTSTGTDIGTAPGQKLGFFGVSPVVQQVGDVANAVAQLGLVAAAVYNLGTATIVGTLPFANGGNGIVAGNDVVTQSGAVSNLAAYTPGTTSTYRIGVYLTIISVTTDVLQVQVTYTDENTVSRTQTFASAGGTTSFGSTGAFVFPTMDIRCKVSTTITVKTILSVSGGSISYDVGARIQAV